MNASGLIWTILVILVVLWAIGFFVANLGSVIHVLLVLAVIALLYNLLAGPRATV